MMPSATLSEATIHYEERGNGTPILLIHGNGCTANTWAPIVGGLSKHGRVIAYDRRGYGRSKGPSAMKTTYFAQHANDAAELLGLLKSGPAIVVGWSGGGLMAMHLALLRPDLVEKLVLVEPPYHLKVHMTLPLLVTALRMKFWAALGRPRNGALAFFRFVTAYRHGGCAFDRLGQGEKDEMLREASNTLWEFDAGTAEEITPERLKDIRCPVHLMLGELTPPTLASATQRLARSNPDWKLVSVADAAHLMHVDQPEAFVSAIRTACSI
jgi:pimeloyl-ACP methyl ester carboxylesterase